MIKEVFSDYEVDEIGFKFEKETDYQSAKCVGGSNEEMEVRVIKKLCRGIVDKEIVKPTGRGKVKIKLHIPKSICDKMFGMNLDTLIEGVKGYGRNSVHGHFSMVQHVTDEDGVEKLKAYPNCVVESGKKSDVENGAEEVAQVELDISVSPDEYGQGVYEALYEEVDETVASTWMTKFTPELVQKV